ARHVTIEVWIVAGGHKRRPAAFADLIPGKVEEAAIQAPDTAHGLLLSLRPCGLRSPPGGEFEGVQAPVADAGEFRRLRPARHHHVKPGSNPEHTHTALRLHPFQNGRLELDLNPTVSIL